MIRILAFTALMTPAMAFAQTAAVPPAGEATSVTAVPADLARPAVTATRRDLPNSETAILPANTEILVRLSEAVNSKLHKEGHVFRVSVAQDVMLGNYLVIPKGTPGTGTIIYRTGKGAFGKSAKMEIDIRSIDLPNGRTIPMSGKLRQEGQGNTGATVATAVAVGVFSAFVTGRSAIFEEGREVRAFTREALPVALPQA